MLYKSNTKHINEGEGEIICLFNLLTMTISYEGYSRDASCALTYISTFLFQWSSSKI